jgi:hypothetical protein
MLRILRNEPMLSKLGDDPSPVVLIALQLLAHFPFLVIQVPFWGDAAVQI